MFQNASNKLPNVKLPLLLKLITFRVVVELKCSSKYEMDFFFFFFPCKRDFLAVTELSFHV